MTHRRTNLGTKAAYLLSLYVYSIKNFLKLHRTINSSKTFSVRLLASCFSQGLFAEYIELLVQFGYLSLFSCVYPLTAVLLLINNITEIRTDAYKICKLFRKPFTPPVAGMGVWQVSMKHNTQYKWGAPGMSRLTSYEWTAHIIVLCVQTAFEVLSFASVVSNCWLLLLSPRLQELYQESKMSGTNILVFAVMVEVRRRMEGLSLSYICEFSSDIFTFVWFCSMCSS